MAKYKYHFNTDSHKIEKVKITFRERLKRMTSVAISGIAFAVIIVAAAFLFFESPREKILERELEQYELQYEIMNDRLEVMEEVLNDLQDRDDNIYRVILEAEPVSEEKRKAGYGGVDRYATLEGYKNSPVIIETAKKLDRLSGQLYVQSVSFDEVFEMAKNKEEMLAHIPAIQPVKNEDLKRISSYYGYRTDPFYKVKKFHGGLDFSSTTGTEVYATGDGKVLRIIRSRRGYGNTIIIDHGYNYKTKYSHLHSFAVSRGQSVKRGQVIGYVGNSGKSTAPHLHYEVIKNDRSVNPIYYFYNDLTPDEFKEIIERSLLPTQSMD